ncbi:MAG: hypothetical protein LC114_17665 [Bryobacterales bacterium]|nr:hypothetical protein [Bryobacterales bacterium]
MAGVVANAAELFPDVSIRKHRDYPVDFPYSSAYAYFPGMSLGQYGAEQMAQACHRGEKKIRDYVKSIRAYAKATEADLSARMDTQFGVRFVALSQSTGSPGTPALSRFGGQLRSTAADVDIPLLLGKPRQ